MLPKLLLGQAGKEMVVALIEIRNNIKGDTSLVENNKFCLDMSNLRCLQTQSYLANGLKYVSGI